MSTRRKGNRNRRRVQHYFSDIGYITANVEKTGKFVSEKDLFALSEGEDYNDKGFDVLAIKKHRVLLIQVKSNTPAVQAFYRDFAKKYACECIGVICATVIDYKGMRIQEYQYDGTIEERFVDIKDMP